MGPITSVDVSLLLKIFVHGTQNLSLAISPSVVAGNENTTFLIPDQNIAPVHIGQGSQDVYKVEFPIFFFDNPVFQAKFIKFISAWHVGLESMHSVLGLQNNFIIQN